MSMGVQDQRDGGYAMAGPKGSAGSNAAIISLSLLVEPP